MGGFGAFGKLPSMGDFIHVSLPRGFVAPWDAWVQAGILAARAQLGERWQACYFAAPIWRFTLAPGLAGPAALQGVLMPSVDRVGRQFPLTLVAAVRGAANPDVFAAHMAGQNSFAVLEDLALDALGDTMTPRVLADRLLGIDVGPVAAVTALPGLGAGDYGVARCSGRLTDALVQNLRSQGFARPSLWTAEWGDETRVYVQNGLPPPERMCDFYDGDAVLWQTSVTEGAPR